MLGNPFDLGFYSGSTEWNRSLHPADRCGQMTSSSCFFLPAAECPTLSGVGSM